MEVIEQEYFTAELYHLSMETPILCLCSIPPNEGECGKVRV